MECQSRMMLQFGAPADGLVEQFEVLGRGALAPGDRVNGDAHQFRPQLFDLEEMVFGPVPLHFEFIGIGNG